MALSMDKVVPNAELKDRIQAWKKEKMEAKLWSSATSVYVYINKKFTTVFVSHLTDEQVVNDQILLQQQNKGWIQNGSIFFFIQ